MASRLSLFRLLRALASALAFRPIQSLSTLETIVLVITHVVGVGVLARYFNIPAWGTMAVLVCLAAVVLLLRALRLSPALLTPLYLAYAIAVIRWGLVHLFEQGVPGYFDYEYPDLRLPLLLVEPALLAAIAVTLVAVAVAATRSPRRVAVAFSAAALTAGMIWGAADFVGHRTSGASGSDPYGYTQMALDIADHCAPVHRFELFTEVTSLQIPWYPLVPVGYRLPMNVAGDAVTVWPAGASYTFALVARVFGESAIYWVNPLFTLLSALATALLAWELLADSPLAVRLAVGVLSAILILTSNEQAHWAVVPMADAQAEFYSILAIYFALAAHRRPHLAWSLLCGASLGLAYWVRHTQLLLAPALTYLLWAPRAGSRERILGILAAGVAALAVAIPDLWYHQLYFGGWNHPESEELTLYSLASIGDTSGRLLQSALAGNEFGWLLPFILYGLFRLPRRPALAALALWLIPIVLIHLPYPALRLRDLLPEAPILAILAAFGIGRILQDLRSSSKVGLGACAGVVLWLALELLFIRFSTVVPRVASSEEPIFGYVTSSQRSSFASIATVVPRSGIVGASLNGGAIQLYARRSSFRPDGWDETQFAEFLRNVLPRHPVFVLEDSNTVEEALGRLSGFTVRRVAQFDVPLFGDSPAADPGGLYEINLE